MNPTITLASGFGLLLSIAAALGSHAIPPASVDMRASWDTALLCGYVHALAAVGAAILSPERPLARYAGWSFLVGVLTFSMTILASSAATASAADAGTEPNWLGDVSVLAPVGGAAFMIGWALLTIAAMRDRA